MDLPSNVPMVEGRFPILSVPPAVLLPCSIQNINKFLAWEWQPLGAKQSHSVVSHIRDCVPSLFAKQGLDTCLLRKLKDLIGDLLSALAVTLLIGHQNFFLVLITKDFEELWHFCIENVNKVV
jgi:hypothetical protein